MAHNVEKEIDGVIRTVTELDHTAQEIDDAVEVTKVHSNPQLLDNWYWAGPDSIIDQRGGWIVPYGTPFYSDVALSAQVTTVQAPWFAATYINETYGSIYTDNQTFYVSRADMVRGYTGGVYSIDRWIISGGGTVVLTDKGINIKRRTEGVSDGAFYIRCEMARFLEKTCTLSALANGELYTCTGKIPDVVSNSTKLLFYSDITMPILVRVYETASGLLEFGIVNQGDGDCITKAAKLELGDHQTLARQDENGNWVLIDPPPNKQQALEKCQSVQTVYEGYSFLGFGIIEQNHMCQFAVPTPSTMRLGTVSVSASNGIKFFDGKNSYDGIILDSRATCNAGSAKTVASFPDAPVFTGGYVWLDNGQKLILDANF